MIKINKASLCNIKICYIRYLKKKYILFKKKFAIYMCHEKKFTEIQKEGIIVAKILEHINSRIFTAIGYSYSFI